MKHGQHLCAEGCGFKPPTLWGKLTHSPTTSPAPKRGLACRSPGIFRSIKDRAPKAPITGWPNRDWWKILRPKTLVTSGLKTHVHGRSWYHGSLIFELNMWISFWTDTVSTHVELWWGVLQATSEIPLAASPRAGRIRNFWTHHGSSHSQLNNIPSSNQTWQWDIMDYIYNGQTSYHYLWCHDTPI